VVDSDTPATTAGAAQERPDGTRADQPAGDERSGHPRDGARGSRRPAGAAGRRKEVAGEIQEQLRQLCLSLFLRDDMPIRSLGLTSSLQGEGKTLLATTMAGILADDISVPVTLLECNWDHPCAHEYFAVDAAPGLAEWVRGEASVYDVRRPARPNLTVIPTGESRRDAVRLMRHLQSTGVDGLLAQPDEILIVDLPPLVSCAYGSMAASLVESLILVVQAGKTPERAVAESSAQLASLPVAGVILNQVASRIPRWLQQLL
jgi:Mrp family chromosome partitioning ATPase